MSNTPKKYTPAEKAKIALEAINYRVESRPS